MLTADVACFHSLIARFMGPTWGPSGAGRAQVGPMLVPRTLLSGLGKECLPQQNLNVNALLNGKTSSFQSAFCTLLYMRPYVRASVSNQEKNESSLSLLCFVHHVWIYHCVMRFQLWSRHMEYDVIVTSLTSNKLTKCTQKTEECISQYEQWHHICMYLCNDDCSDGHFNILRFTRFFYIHGVQCIAPSAWLDCIV